MSSIFNSCTFNMESTNNPTPKEVLAAATKLACQPNVTLYDIEELINMIDRAHHHFIESITPFAGERGKALSAVEQKRNALRMQLLSMKQGIVGLAARTDGALQFLDYMRKTGMYWPSQTFL
ncbi:hypothetical protein IW261DRAFT_1571511 [Armillaria novae-zelandiae]|uniref:Uncharacterized protein n=1 Tax=Armillaria novae-zelandiae TaxID=153914 RepID=A0AA39NUS0_9AGAR|nr:hypothetical protein IW261DRAFT_1576172 [Armillaria novae-zelandiae]KAK0471848.1 hypothetical protein IW261DRAFT_1571511 [Armillaria novae-zelandiae]